MRSIPRTVTAIVGATTFAAMSACATTPADDPASDDRAAEGLVVAILPHEFQTDYNPMVYAHTYWLPGHAVYEPLIEWDQENNVYVPRLAEEFQLSDDRLSMQVKLRENVYFTDGQHMNAAGVEKALDAVFASEDFWLYGSLTGIWGTEVAATGEYTLEITTKSAMDLLFFNYFTLVPIASPVAIDNPESLTEHPVGTGPYIIDELVPDVSISYSRNPDYWSPDEFDFDTLELRVFDDQVAALNALKSGQIDAAMLDIPLAVEAEANGLTVHTGGGEFASLAVIDRAGEQVPALADQRVRQAMNLAFDRDAIVESLYLGYASASSQPFSEVMAEYVEGGDDYYEYDLERARELMAEAGYADGFDFTIPTEPGLTSLEPIVEQSLGDIGIRVSYEPYPDAPAWAEAIQSGEFAVAMTSMPYVNVIPFYAAAGDNLLNPNDHVDPVFEEFFAATKSGTSEESAEAARDIGEYVLDQAWWVSIAHQQIVWATKPDIDMVVGRVVGNPLLSSFTLVD